MEGSSPNGYRLSSVDDDKESTPLRPHLPIQPIQPIRPIHLDNLRATSTSLSALHLQQARLLLFPYFIECSEPLFLLVAFNCLRKVFGRLFELGFAVGVDQIRHTEIELRQQ